MKKIITLVGIALLGVANVFAQHEVAPSLASQVFSRVNYNPAGIGNSSNINIFSQTNLQWLGFGDNTPKSEVLNIHSFIERYKSGIGATLTYDKLGYSSNVVAQLAYCYNLDLSETAILAFGLSAGINQFSNDLSSSNADFTESSGLFDNYKNKTNADINFGIEYSSPYFMIGVAADHLGQTDSITTMHPTQTYYAYGRGAIPVNEDIMIAPSILYMNSNMTNCLDISAVGFYQSRFWAGLGSDILAPTLSVMLGFEWNFLRVGYAYEMSFDLGNYNTHQIMLSFNIPTHSDHSGALNVKKGRRR